MIFPAHVVVFVGEGHDLRVRDRRLPGGDVIGNFDDWIRLYWWCRVRLEVREHVTSDPSLGGDRQFQLPFRDGGPFVRRSLRRR